MEKDFNIQKELQEIAPFLASLSCKNPFKVPTGYFENNGEDAAFVASEKEVEIPAIIQKHTTSTSPFKVPSTYFEDNLSAIPYIYSDKSIEIPSIIKEHTNLTAFKVPRAYFETLSQQIWEGVKASEGEEMTLSQKITFPASVPNGYFATLNQRILEGVKASEGEEMTLSQKITFPASVPNDYFATLNERMWEGVNANDEEEITLSQKITFPASVPTDYFETLSSRVMERIQLEAAAEAPVALEHLKDDTAYSVPNDYFANLSSRIMDSVKAADTQEEAPIDLEHLKDEKAYAIPENYFETFPQRVWDRIKEEEGKGKVIQMQQKETGGSRFRLVPILSSVAAMLMLFMIGSYFFTGGGIGTPPATPFNLNQELAGLSDADFNQLLLAEELDEAVILEELDGEGDIFTFSKQLDMDEVREYLLQELDDENLNDII